jgi:hypothetical protein
MEETLKNKHIVLRNQKLFCAHCGTSQDIPFPVPVNVFAAYGEDFTKRHTDCKKTWTQPFPDQTKTEIEKAQFWAIHGERGISSETIYSVICEEPLLPLLKQNSFCHPLDPDDFRRCYLLIKSVPEWKAKLEKMRSISAVWDKLVTHWNKLEKMLEEQLETHKANGMYEFMKSLGC